MRWASVTGAGEVGGGRSTAVAASVSGDGRERGGGGDDRQGPRVSERERARGRSGPRALGRPGRWAAGERMKGGEAAWPAGPKGGGGERGEVG